MANTFANFPAIIANQTPPQTHNLEDGTSYVAHDISDSGTPLFVWRLQALELALEVLSRADVILSPQDADQTVMNGLTGIDYIVYNVTQLAPARGEQVITRGFVSGGEDFYIGRDINVGSYLQHRY